MTLTYQWKANGVAITGATATTYKPIAADAGKTLTVTVTGTKTGYTTAAKTSTATAVVAKGSLGRRRYRPSRARLRSARP